MKINWFSTELKLLRIAVALLIIGVAGSYYFGYKKGVEDVIGTQKAIADSCIGGSLEGSNEGGQVLIYCVQND